MNARTLSNKLKRFQVNFVADRGSLEGQIVLALFYFLGIHPPSAHTVWSFTFPGQRCSVSLFLLDDTNYIQCLTLEAGGLCVAGVRLGFLGSRSTRPRNAPRTHDAGQEASPSFSGHPSKGFGARGFAGGPGARGSVFIGGIARREMERGEDIFL